METPAQIRARDAVSNRPRTARERIEQLEALQAARRDEIRRLGEVCRREQRRIDNLRAQELQQQPDEPPRPVLSAL
jgi:hypothetical protein